LLAEVAHGELGFGEREGGLSHHFAHQRLRLDDSLEDLPEAHHEGVCFLFEQVAARLGALQTSLHYCLSPEIITTAF